VATAAANPSFELTLRTRTDKGVATLREKFNPAESAMILCDLWDNHWCKGAVTRVNQLVPRFALVLESARRAGFIVIHAPSDTMGFYADSPQRRKMTELTRRYARAACAARSRLADRRDRRRLRHAG
jgi:hypothetical protein